jgi:hypothetical protein
MTLIILGRGLVMNKVFMTIARIFAAITGIIGIVALVYSIHLEIISQQVDEINIRALFFLACAYLAIVGAVGIFKCSGLHFVKDITHISYNSFYAFCLLFPSIIIMAFTGLVNLDMPKDMIVYICWGIQLIFITGWFAFYLYKLNKTDKVSDSDYMKLDYYSTIAILPLTMVWVIYDIGYIKIGFAILLGEFMAIQLFIKNALIKRCKS